MKKCIFLIYFFSLHISLFSQPTAISNSNLNLATLNTTNNFSKIRNSLVELEKNKVLYFFFNKNKEDYISQEKQKKKNLTIKKLLKEFPELKNKEQEKEIFSFHAYLMYSRTLEEIQNIQQEIQNTKELSSDQKGYLTTYSKLLIINIWIKLQQQQKRQPNNEIYSIVGNISPPPLTSKLEKVILSEYYTFYAEINFLLAQIKSGFLEDFINQQNFFFENEIFLTKAINLNSKNFRALLHYVLSRLNFNRGKDYFFQYIIIKNLQEILPSVKLNKYQTFTINILLANIYYQKNDLKKSWYYIQKAKANFPKNEFINHIKDNFKNRTKTLIKI